MCLERAGNFGNAASQRLLTYRCDQALRARTVRQVRSCCRACKCMRTRRAKRSLSRSLVQECTATSRENHTLLLLGKEVILRVPVPKHFDRVFKYPSSCLPQSRPATALGSTTRPCSGRRCSMSVPFPLQCQHRLARWAGHACDAPLFRRLHPHMQPRPCHHLPAEHEAAMSQVVALAGFIFSTGHVVLSPHDLL